MKFLAMHITDQKLSFDFWHKRKMDNFDPYNVFLAIAFVLQGHKYAISEGHVCILCLKWSIKY